MQIGNVSSRSFISYGELKIMCNRVVYSGGDKEDLLSTLTDFSLRINKENPSEAILSLCAIARAKMAITRSEKPTEVSEAVALLGEEGDLDFTSFNRVNSLCALAKTFIQGEEYEVAETYLDQAADLVHKKAIGEDLMTFSYLLLEYPLTEANASIYANFFRDRAVHDCKIARRYFECFKKEKGNQQLSFVKSLFHSLNCVDHLRNTPLLNEIEVMIIKAMTVEIRKVRV